MYREGLASGIDLRHRFRLSIHDVQKGNDAANEWVKIKTKHFTCNRSFAQIAAKYDFAVFAIN